MRKVLVCLALLAYAVLPWACTARSAKVDYRQSSERYLARKLLWYAGEKVFVALEVFGRDTKGANTSVYAWCLRQGFLQRDGQAILEDAAGMPLAVFFARRWWRGDVEPVSYQQPKVDVGFRQSVQRLFPRPLWPRALGKLPPALYGRLRREVIAYFAARMPAGRFVRKAPPAIFANAHRHEDPIYDYLNLRAPYAKISIQPAPRPVLPANREGPVTSPDKRFEAWTGAAKGMHLYFRDKTTNKVYEIVNRTNDWQVGLAWKSDDTLIFDQINGFNTFGDGRNDGVHLEVDAVKRRLVWAVPFGPLGFPEKI